MLVTFVDSFELKHVPASFFCYRSRTWLIRSWWRVAN